MILAADIGGTKAEFAVYKQSKHGLKAEWQQRYASAHYVSFNELCAQLCKDLTEAGICLDALKQASFAVAGPIKKNTCQTTNLPWFLEGQQLAETFQLETLSLLNDVEASALCMPHLGSEHFVPITVCQQGESDQAIAIVAPGTGLGEAALFWTGSRYQAQVSEGGHKDFAAKNPLEFALYEFAEQRFPGHVSWERLLGGSGFSLMYDFLSQHRGLQDGPDILNTLSEGDRNAAITRLALAQQSALCQQTLALYINLLAAEAANVALQYLALSGVILTGGIPPKIISALNSQIFVDAFINKGRYRALLQQIPVRVCMKKDSALLGAAYHAAEKSVQHGV